MRLSLLLATLMSGGLAWLAVGTEPAPAKPFGLTRRIPWTTSKVVGSPEPPLPFRVRRTFPDLKLVCPIHVHHEPGTKQLLLIHQAWPWVGPGRILRIEDGGTAKEAEVLLSLDRTVYGLAFHPDFAKNGYIYLGGNGPVTDEDLDIPGQRFRPGVAKTNRIARFTIDRKAPFACDPKSEKVILEWPSNGHNGADLAFGPDGMLYISSGDGTADSDTDLAGQDLSRLLAKVLRIDVDHPAEGKAYSVPKDNPFLKTPGARPETWAYGFRNPWRLHIDRPTGDLWVGQNGQDLWEQIYLVQCGANYGWSLVEGTHPFYPQRKPGPTPISKPIAEHHHSEARSLTGGLVYRGDQLPELRGAYLYGDWSTGKIWGLRHDRGKVTWHQELARTSLQITGFGLDSKGEVLIVDFGGGLYQLEPAPKDPNPPKFPTRLSETGLFLSVKDHRPDPALIPYSVNAPLWSDGADKERFIALPGVLPIDFTAERGWNFPDGAVLVKTFSLSQRRIETRLLTKQGGEWAGYSYLWNDEQTDATLVEGKGLDRVYTVGQRQQSWHYPSRTECMVCHSRAANFVLGLSVLQMNRDHDYGGVVDNQLRALEHVGAFRVSGVEQLRDAKRWLGWTSGLLSAIEQQSRFTSTLPRQPDYYPRLADPADAKADLTARARSYLHANCAQCHVRAGGGNAPIDLEFATPRDGMRAFGVRPQHQDFAVKDPLLLAPGDPDRSILIQRVTRRGPGQMPPLATSEIDRQAVELLREWIKQQK